MKRVAAMLMSLTLLGCVLAGCSPAAGNNEPPADSQNPVESSAADPAEVNLMDMYTVKDPEGVEYDQRVAFYMPILESDEHYADGCRYLFTVLYGLEDKGVYMYSVEIYETQEQAEAYQTASEAGEVDGTAYITASDATFFTAMESFFPDFASWLDSMTASGMMELE